MREKLLQGVKRLCWLYPQLNPSIKYSDVLSQEEVDLFVAFANGHVQQVLRDFATDEKRQECEVALLLQGSTGLSKLHQDDVTLVEGILSSASGGDAGLSPEMRDIADFLRGHRKIWWALHNTYEKIVKNHLVNTCPIVVAKPPFLDRLVPFGHSFHKFHEFHKLFHESIHNVLEENGILFDDPDLNEGLVAYLHGQVMGKKACQLHYAGEQGQRYLKNSAVFEKLIGKYPRSAVIPILQNLKKEDLFKAQ